MGKIRFVVCALLVSTAGLGLSGCGTTSGAVVGGVAGAAVGGTAATVGGAVIGGVIGHENAKSR